MVDDSVEHPSISPRAADLPLGPSEVALSDCAERIRNNRIRHSARNAFAHLKGAWKLRPVDPEMSLFRLITSEEEAATSLILGLKQQKYPGAQKLNHRDHKHKAAIWPFIEAVAFGLREKAVPMPNLGLSTKGIPKLTLTFDISALIGSKEHVWVEPDHPFNFVMNSDENGSFEVHKWERELLSKAVENGFPNIKAHIESEANLRNRIIYASEDGIPNVEFTDNLIFNRLLRVTWMLLITVGIIQTRKHQLFIIQGLEALLRAIDRFDGESFNFPAQDPNAIQLPPWTSSKP